MFENFRERLHVVQQDLSSGFKTLGDVSRDGKTRRRFEERHPHLRAGVEILSRYEDSWFLLHKRSQESAQAAEAVDGDVVVLSAHWEKRRAALIQLQEQLHSLPDFVREFDAITAKIAHLEGDFEEMESRLVYLETLCCQCDQQTVKNQHMNQLEIYKKKKRKEVELLEVDLNLEHAQRVAELERAMQQKLRERQKVYEEAFNQDIEEYLSTGHLQHADTSAEMQMKGILNTPPFQPQNQNQSPSRNTHMNLQATTGLTPREPRTAPHQSRLRAPGGGESAGMGNWAVESEEDGPLSHFTYTAVERGQTLIGPVVQWNSECLGFLKNR